MFIQAVQALTTPTQYVYEEHLRHEAKKFFLRDQHWHIARVWKIGPARCELVLHPAASPMSSDDRAKSNWSIGLRRRVEAGNWHAPTPLMTPSNRDASLIPSRFVRATTDAAAR